MDEQENKNPFAENEKIIKMKKPSLKIWGIVGAMVIIIAVVFAVKNIDKNDEPALPATIQIPLYNKKKVAKVSFNETFKQQEIIFYSSASMDEVMKYYKEWAVPNGFSFFNQQRVEGIYSTSQQSFSLIPGLGKNGLFTYNFLLESQGNVTRIIFSYSDTAPVEINPSVEINPQNTQKIPKGFKLKL